MIFLFNFRSIIFGQPSHDLQLMGTFFEPKVNWSADICLFCNDRIFISFGKNLVDQKSLKLRNVIIEDIPDVSDSSKSIFFQWS